MIDMKHYSAKRKAAVLPEDAAEALYHWRKQAMARGENECGEQEEGRKGWSAESKLTVVLKMALLSEVEWS